MTPIDSNPTNYFVHTLLRARDWQHRPEFEQVCDWWRKGGQGVCGLVGIGGAGKTAIVDRFLQVLPGVVPLNPDIPKDETLRTPNSTFVFSFYDAPNVEAFFQSLQMWLVQSPDVEATVSYSKLLFRMQNAVPGLIVLDGLEKVQEDGTRGIFGQLSTPNLRDFVKRAANGYFPRLRVLITTRFPLADLQEEQPAFFRSIPIEEIDSPTGIKLLRQRGVQGNDLELERIVEECGNHALTVDLAGGYIKEYGNGDPNTSLALGTADELVDAVRQEQDPAKRALLKQGKRFARVAQRYREAMSKHDPAAIALLERICLFRLGVEAKTLVAIFTGEDAVKVSGTALAGLNTQQLQRKLDWLERMRIIEVTRIKSRQNGQIRELYNIHPAVRDGFVQGIGGDIATVSHTAIRTGLEVSLGDAPGENPSDPAILDLLEEIVYHAIASGQMPKAWEIYWNKIGAYKNLLWQLGAYERGERICRAFGGGQSPETVAALLQKPHPSKSLPCLALTEADQAIFINEWALYLQNLGHLDAAARCYEANIAMRMQQKNWQNASVGNQNLSQLWLLAGRLRLAQATAKEALRLAEKADKTEERMDSYLWQCTTNGLLGAVSTALEDFRQCLHWQHQVDGNDNPLYSLIGIYHTLLLTRLGRHGEAQRLTEANKKILANGWGSNHQDIPKCNLILANLAIKDDIQSAHSFYDYAQTWALARDSKGTLCWAALVKARIELAEVNTQQLEGKTKRLQTAQDVLTEGLKIARDCGYGIYHIDLLLEQAHLHLLQGNPQAALDDICVALDSGIPVNDQTGQPEFLAANNPECGYVWGIVEGLHHRAQALLLKAAQTLGSDSFAPAKRTALPAAVQTLITQAETCLQEAMDRWHDLRDREVSESNFIHPDTHEEYNYRAADTYQVQEDLQGGLLTRYPLQSTNIDSNITPSKTGPTPQDPTPKSKNSSSETKPINVFISYSWDSEEHKERVLQLANVLREQGIICEIDRYNLSPTEGWYRWMMNQIDLSDFVLVVCTETYKLRYRNKEKRGVGKGVTWEGGLIISELYTGQGINKKFIPVIFKSGDAEYVPASLNSYTLYQLFDDEYDPHKPGDYQQLYRHLTNQPAVDRPKVGKSIVKLEPINPANAVVNDQGEVITNKVSEVEDET